MAQVSNRAVGLDIIFQIRVWNFYYRYFHLTFLQENINLIARYLSAVRIAVNSFKDLYKKSLFFLHLSFEIYCIWHMTLVYPFFHATNCFNTAHSELTIQQIVYIDFAYHSGNWINDRRKKNFSGSHFSTGINYGLWAIYKFPSKVCTLYTSA